MIKMKIDYTHAINYIENKLNIQLFDFQKEALQAIIKNQNIFMPRGSGTSTILTALGKYLIYLAKSPESYDGGKYSIKDYDVIITLNDVLNECSSEQCLLNKKMLDKEKTRNPDRFIQDFDLLDNFK